EGAVALLQEDPLRAAIGYGPESMAVVYNRHYPAALAQLESRTASPDRSHNETFDALITTGILGLFAHLALFVSVLLHGLTCLGVVADRRSRHALLGCAAAGGVLGIAIPALLEGKLHLAGVGLPIGVIGGILAYISVRTLFGGVAATSLERWQRILLMSFLAAVVAHWIEISVGIAIASTRVYFWAYAALMVCVTRWQPLPAQQPALPHPTEASAQRASRSSRIRRRVPSRRGMSVSVGREPFLLRPSTLEAAAMAVLLSVIVTMLAWNLIGNPDGAASTSRVLGQALAGGTGPVKVWQRGPLWMALTLIAVITITTVTGWRQSVQTATARQHMLVGAIGLGIPVTSGLLYAIALATSLRPPVDTSTLLGGYVAALLVGALVIAAMLYLAGRQPGRTRVEWRALLYGILLVGVSVVVWKVNVQPIRADVIYKQGLRHDAAIEWEQAAAAYELASAEAPYEDYYLLFAGRARLEQARAATDAAQRDGLFQAAIARLEQARALNPLNTDHAANLARAYRSWAEADPDAASRAQRLDRAVQYYAQAIDLSPQNVQLRNELGMTHAALGDTARARTSYQGSLALDDRYAMTYLLLGDLHLDNEEWAEAISLYETATELTPGSVAAWSRLAYAYAKAERWDDAITANLAVLELVPEDLVTLRNLAYVYSTRQDSATAIEYLDRALAVATGDEAVALRALRQQLER
ncbi:MAG: tetratricopeptide repeat protein, partial [Anaerolineae bacterium]